MPKYTISYDYVEYRIREVEAPTEAEAVAIVGQAASAGDLDHNAYILDGHHPDITNVSSDEKRPCPECGLIEGCHTSSCTLDPDNAVCFVAPKGDPPGAAPEEPQISIQIQKRRLDAARTTWAKVAKDNGWYQEPFHIQVWVFADGLINDSVSFDQTRLTEDLFVLVEEDEDSEYEGDVNEIRVLRSDEVEII